MPNQIDESTLRIRLREILDVPEGASRRQLRRARDREVQRCRDDMLSKDEQLNAIAKRRLDELNKAFEYLTEPKKFRDYMELVNRKLESGDLSAPEVASIVRPAERNNGSNGEQSSESAFLDSSGPLEPPNKSIAEEKEVLRELRQKRLATHPKDSRRRRAVMEKLIRETHSSIETAANHGAHQKARELFDIGVANQDEFYEQVYAAAIKEAKEVRDQALEKVHDNELPAEDNLLDQWEADILNMAEKAAEREYREVHGSISMPAQSLTPAARRRAPLGKIVMVIALIAGTLCIFCNIDTFLAVKKPDALSQQISSIGGTGAPPAVDELANLGHLSSTVSDNPVIARADGMAKEAGSAGLAGWSQTLSISGCADYNAGCSAITSGAAGEAVNSFNTAIHKNTNIYQYFYNRGLAYLYLRHLSSASSDMISALKLRTNLVQAKYNLGAIYVAVGADLIDKAYSIKDQTQKSLLLNQAAAVLRSAVIELSDVHNEVPLLAQALYNRGLAEYRLGELTQARADFRAALKIDPNMSAAAHNLKVAESRIANSIAVPTESPPPAPVGPQGPPGPGM